MYSQGWLVVANKTDIVTTRNTFLPKTTRGAGLLLKINAVPLTL